MNTPTTTVGLPFVTDPGLSVLACAAADALEGNTYAVGRNATAAAAKLARDGYLTKVRTGQYTLTDRGKHWASVHAEARRLLREYAEAIRHEDGQCEDRMVLAAYYGRIDGYRNLATAAFVALFPGLSWDNAKNWAVEAACDHASVVGIARFYGEHHRR